MKKLIIATMFLFATLLINAPKAEAASLGYCTTWMPVVKMEGVVPVAGLTRYCHGNGVWDQYYIWFD